MMIIMVEHLYKHTPRVAEQKESWWVPIITATYFPPTHSLILMHVVCDEWVRSLLPFFFFFSSSNPPLYSTHPIITNIMLYYHYYIFSVSSFFPLLHQVHFTVLLSESFFLSSVNLITQRTLFNHIR